MADHVQRLIDEGLNRLGWASDSAHRNRYLDKLNESEREIAQPGSFLYLQRLYSITLANNAVSAPLPTSPSVPNIDFGKSMSLRIVSEPGYLTYYAPDRFRVGSASSYYALRNDRPSAWTLERDTSSVLTIFVDPANTTLGNLTLELSAQMAVTTLTDANTSFSLLPDGYEWTLLLGRAEAKLLGELDRPFYQAKKADNDALLQAFYSGQRTQKKFPQTDPETERRKADEDLLDPELD